MGDSLQKPAHTLRTLTRATKNRFKASIGEGFGVQQAIKKALVKINDPVELKESQNQQLFGGTREKGDAASCCIVPEFLCRFLA